MAAQKKVRFRLPEEADYISAAKPAAEPAPRTAKRAEGGEKDGGSAKRARKTGPVAVLVNVRWRGDDNRAALLERDVVVRACGRCDVWDVWCAAARACRRLRGLRIYRKVLMSDVAGRRFRRVEDGALAEVWRRSMPRWVFVAEREHEGCALM